MKVLFAIMLPVMGILLGNCKSSEESVDIMPVIKSITFAGIAEKDVIFDKRNFTITVQLPPILQGGLEPTIQLSQDAKVIRGLTTNNMVDLSSFCYCNKGSNKEELSILIGNNLITTTYRLVVLPPKGSIKPQLTNVPILFSRQTQLLSMSLPVENLYTHPSVDNLLFTNVATGLSTRIYADGACLNTCTNDAANALVFHLASPIEKDLTAGTYAIAIQAKDGLIHFPQPLIVTD